MIGRKLLSHMENMMESKELALCSRPDLAYDPAYDPSISSLLSVSFTFLIY